MYSLLVILCLLIASCSLFSYSYRKPLLNRKDREEYIVSIGWSYSTNNKLAFIDGRIISGMPVDLVLQLYGKPDLSLPCTKMSKECDRIWVYNTNNNVVFGSVSVKDTLAVKATGQLILPSRF